MMILDATHPLYAIVKAELRSGEQVLWMGQPDARLMAMKEIGAFVVGIPWTLLSVAAGFMAARSSPVSLFLLAPFVYVGLLLLSGPVRSSSDAKKMVYALTKDRILVMEGGKTKTVTSYENINLHEIKRIERADESGDLIFAHKLYKDSEGDERIADIKFVGIPDVRQVEYLVRTTFAK